MFLVLHLPAILSHRILQIVLHITCSKADQLFFNCDTIYTVRNFPELLALMFSHTATAIFRAQHCNELFILLTHGITTVR